MSKSVLGIDVSKDTLDVVLLNEGKNHHAIMENNEVGFIEINKWLRKHKAGEVHACLEATGQYSTPIAEYLFAKGHLVSVVNPLRIKAFGQSRLIRNKTDKLDAHLIAEFYLSQKPPIWTQPEPVVREVQELVRHLEDLQSMYQQEQNRLKSGVRSQLVIDNLKKHIAYLGKQIKEVKKSIQEHMNQNCELKRQQRLLETIPGIGKLTAAKLLGEIQNIRSFESAAQLAAYAGVTPRQRRSGSSVRGKSRLVKTGNANLRKALFMPALVAKKHNPIIAAFCKRLEKRGKQPKVIVGAAMRKLLHISYGVLKSEKAFDPIYLHNLQIAS